jgi:hypothetical protein
MWFRRKNKPESDHSVLSSTLVSLQGLLDEKPIPHEPEQIRREPTIPTANAEAALSNEPATDAEIEPEITEVRDMLMAADQSSDNSTPTTPQAPSQDTEKKSSGSSWANLDLDFDEVESTAALPAVTDEMPTEPPPAPTAPTLDSDLEPDEEIEAAPPPDEEISLEAPVDDDTIPKSDSTDDEDENGTTTTLFDVIPTLSEVVFDPDAEAATSAVASEPAEAEVEVEATEPEVEPVEPEAERVEPETEPVEPAQIAIEPTPIEEPSPVIVAGASSTPKNAADPNAAISMDDDIEDPLSTVPLAPSEFAEFVLQRVDNAYHEHLREELPAPYREAARGIILDSIQQWIAQARQVLQKKQ